MKNTSSNVNRKNSMRAYLILTLTLLAAIGCTSSYNVSNKPAPDTYSLAQVNENAKNQSFTISTMDGEEIRATDLFVGDDSTTFLQSPTDKRITIATSSVKIITIKSVGAGAIDGLKVGAIAGTPIGLLFGSIAAKLEDNGMAVDWVAATGLIAGTAVLGAGVGALIRHTDEYIFQSKNNNSQKEK